MALQALEMEQVAPIAQALLQFLDREDVTVPGNMVEQFMSGKSLVRAIAGGQLVVAQEVNEAPEPKPEVSEEAA